MISFSFKQAAIVGAVTAGLVSSPEPVGAHWNDHDEKVYDLSQHHDFIMNIHLPDGKYRCCNGDDVFVDLPEKENADGGYTVVVPAGTVLTRDYRGAVLTKLEKDTKVVVPPERVLTAEQAYKVCRDLIQMGSKTCTAPQVNVLYAPPASLGKASQSTWCYWPVPKGF